MTGQVDRLKRREVSDQSTDPIKSVSVISTGWGEAHKEHMYGTRKPALWWIFAGRRWVRVPLNVYVVERSDGLVLFDAGQDRAVITNPDYWPGRRLRFFMDHIMRFHIDPKDTLTKQLELAGYSVGDVHTAVISHLHADHVGGIREIPQADLVVSSEAWQHMLEPQVERHMVLRRDIDIPGAKWQQITFPPTDDPDLLPFTEAYDLMNDGSMTLLPTPGHLPGSLSMLVRRSAGPPLLFVGDLCYSLDMLMEDRLPPTGDKEQLRETFAKVRGLRERMPDLVILPAHDPLAADALHEATS